MKIVLKLLQYLVALALVVAGACVMAIALAHGLAKAKVEVKPITDAAFLQQLRTGAENAEPLELGAGAGVVLLGLLVARPVLSVRLGKLGKKEREKTLETTLHDLGDAASRVRLAAAEALTEAAEPSTIPSLIRALRDSVSKVRGQAAEALEHMTGLTLDFMDVAPRAVREESVERWQDWWAANKAAILAGTDPRSLGEDADVELVEPVDDEALLPPEEPLPPPAPPSGAQPVSRATPSPAATAPVSRATPRPAATGLRRAEAASAAQAGTVPRRTPVPGSGAADRRRQRRTKSTVISLKEAVRLKHMRRDASPAGSQDAVPLRPEGLATPVPSIEKEGKTPPSGSVQPAPPTEPSGGDEAAEPEGDLPSPD